tara:strand:+ start:108 stop:1142 length:1035 start_codon:yes stop_codon:yes gene_type:complete
MFQYDYENFRKKINYNATLRNDSIHSMQDFFVVDGKQAVVNGNVFDMTTNFHRNLSSKFKIPYSYYNRIKDEEPQLFEKTINTLNKTNKPHLFRTQRIRKPFRIKNILKGKSIGNVRALLSNRYKIMDNKEVLSYLEPKFDKKNFVLLSGYEDDNIMSMKIRFTNLIGQVRQGDTVYGGIYLRNSEVGRSSLTISALIYRLVCTNGLMLPSSETITNTFHLGGKNEIGYSPNYIIPTNALDKLDTVINHLLSKDIFKDNLNILKTTTYKQIKKVKYKKIKEVFQTTDEEEKMIKEEFEKENDFTVYGLIQAFTSTARKLKNIQRSLYLERIGGSLMQSNDKIYA